MTVRMATKSRPYSYELSGLPDVRLAGIKVWRCPRCRAEAPELPRVAELHRLIALTLVMRERLLRGAEVRFLRVQGGFAAKDFAKLIGVDAAHLSRVENGKRRSLGRASDRLVRAIAAVANGGDLARSVLLGDGDHRTSELVAERPNPFFRLYGASWKRAA